MKRKSFFNGLGFADRSSKTPCKFVTKGTMTVILIIVFVLLAAAVAMLVYTVSDYREYKRVSNERLERVLQLSGRNNGIGSTDYSEIMSYIDTKAEDAVSCIGELRERVDADAESTDARIKEIAAAVADITAGTGSEDPGMKTGADAVLLSDDFAALAETVASNKMIAEQTAADLASLTETVNENARTAAAGLAELTEKVNGNEGTAPAGLAELSETVTANAVSAKQTAADLAALTEKVNENAGTAEQTAADLIALTETVNEDARTAAAGLAELKEKVNGNEETISTGLAELSETVTANAVSAKQTAADLAALTEKVNENAGTAEQTAADLIVLMETVNENARTTAACLAELTEKVNGNEETIPTGLAELSETVTANATSAEQTAADLAALTEKVNESAGNAEKTATDLTALTETVNENARTTAACLAELTEKVNGNEETIFAGLAELSETVTANATSAEQTAADLAVLTETVNENARTADAEFAALTETVSGNVLITSEISERLDLLENRMAEYESLKAITVNVGETLVFGRCEQDGNPGNGPEGITWIVLDVQGSKALLISRDVIDQIPYMLSREETTWEHSYAREWLNGTFINAVFDEQERACIVRTTVNNGEETGYAPFGRSNGSDTADKVFLLSYGEAVRYFKMSQNRAARPTVTLMNRGIAYDHETGCCTWWLRSAGGEETKNADIYTNGKIHNSPVNSGNVGVRPALWVDYTSEGFYN